MPKLTDEAVKAALPPAVGNRVLRDSEARGLGLRVTSAGAKVWVFEYETGGKGRRYTIGGTDIFTLAKARKAALDLRARVRLGADPQAERSDKRAAVRAQAVVVAPDTFASVAALFLDDLRKRGRAAAYLRDTRGFLDNHVLPRIGDRALSDVARKDVIILLDDVAENGTVKIIDGKKQHLVGGGVTANRCLAALRACLNFAIDRDLLTVNPCHRVKAPAQERPRDRVLTDGEIRELWAVFESLGGPFGAFFKIALATGQRKSEVSDMTWDELDLEKPTWALAGSRTKNGRPHVIPLPVTVVDILQTLPRKGAWVLTTTGLGPINGFSKAKASVDTRVLAARRESDPEAEPMLDWTIHDLRRSAATGMAQLGVPASVVSRVLNHSATGVTARHYNHYEYLAEKRHALDTWGGHLGRLIAPADDNVFSIAAKRA
jgi:integrase